MFIFTNLVDSNIPPGIQLMLDANSLQLFCMISENKENKNLLVDLDKIVLHEPVRGRIFLAGDAFVEGMIFKKTIQKNDGMVSEIVCPRNVVVYHYFVPKKS